MRYMEVVVFASKYKKNYTEKKFLGSIIFIFTLYKYPCG